jgi:hypothetical protein
MIEALEKTLELSRRLLALEQCGEPSESAEAEAIRDESDRWWLLLTEDEKAQARQAAEDAMRAKERG